MTRCKVSAMPQHGWCMSAERHQQRTCCATCDYFENRLVTFVRNFRGWPCGKAAPILVAVVLSLLALTPMSGFATDSKRSPSVVNQFKRGNPCPANGNQRGPCPGYEIDHLRPLKCGGADVPSNMQWLTINAHREKTKREARSCRNGSSVPE